MPKLKTLKPLIGKLPSRFPTYQPGNEQARSRFRDDTQAWRRWYKLARWQKLRWSILVRDHFTCKMCERIEGNTSQLVGDHIKPHRGDEAMFWDANNIQCLCKSCHDRLKQAEERRNA